VVKPGALALAEWRAYLAGLGETGKKAP